LRATPNFNMQDLVDKGEARGARGIVEVVDLHSLFLSLSLSHTQTLTHALSLSLTHTLTYTRTLLKRARRGAPGTLLRLWTFARALSFSLSLSLARSLRFTHTSNQTHTHKHSHTHSLSLIHTQVPLQDLVEEGEARGARDVVQVVERGARRQHVDGLAHRPVSRGNLTFWQRKVLATKRLTFWQRKVLATKRSGDVRIVVEVVERAARRQRVDGLAHGPTSLVAYISRADATLLACVSRADAYIGGLYE